MSDFLYPHAYSPGQFAMPGNPELSQLITMFGGPVISGLAGPNNFAPHLNPGQNLMDQFVMKNYQQQMRAAYMHLPKKQQPQVANTLLGMRAAVTNQKATAYDRETAMNMAGIVTNPITQTLLGSVLGPDTVEALTYGSQGNMQALGGAINRMGYFRQDPGGGARMDAESLEDLTSGIFSHIYEPQGNLDDLLSTARTGTADQKEQAISRLRTAAKTNKRAVDDETVSKRMADLGDDRVQNLYTKYVQGGEATDAAEQIKELTKFDDAISAAGVLDPDEISLAGLQDEAKKRPTREMHGLRAGQVAQITKHISERGLLPPTVGRLSAEQQVQSIAEAGLDDATLDRLARTAAERAILARDDDDTKTFKTKTRAEQNRLIDQELSQTDYRAKIQDTFNSAQATSRGEAGAKSAEEVLEQFGSEALVSNVDAGRVGGKLKEYSKAVAAVKDIFGDNGNPNAPMPALLAVLDQLTQGGMHQMGAEKAGNTLRQMQSLARDTGTGMQQLAAMSSYAGGIGRQLGIAPSITMQNVANTMGITRSMMDNGVFSSEAFGSLSKEEMQLQLTKDLQESDTSSNAKSMASLAAIYAMDPEKYAGTELEQFVNAYNDPTTQGNYTAPDGTEKNVYDVIGSQGMYGARDILEQSGGDIGQFESRYYDSRTMQFAQAGAGFLTRKRELVDTLATFSSDGFVSKGLGDTNIAGLTEADHQGISDVLTELALDTSNMNLPEQVDAIQADAEKKLAEHFQKTKNVSEKEAATMAAQVAQTLNLSDRGTVDKFVGNLGVTSEMMFGENLTVQGQKYGGNVDRQGFMEVGVQRQKAERIQEYGGTGTLAGRTIDYFNKIGESGQAFVVEDFMKEVGGFLPTEELRQQFSGAMAPGLNASEKLLRKYSRSADDIKGIKDEGKLRELAGVTDPDKTVVVADETIDAATSKKIADMDVPTVTKTLTNLGVDVTGMSEARQRQELRENKKFAADSKKEYLDQIQAQEGNSDKNVIAHSTLVQRAIARSVGQAKEGEEDKHAAALRINTGLLRGANYDNRRRAIDDVGGLFADQLKGTDFEEVKKAVLSSDPDKEQKLAAALGFKDADALSAAVADPENAKSEIFQILQALQKSGAFDLEGRGVQASDPAAKQKTERVSVESASVELRADSVTINGAEEHMAALRAEIETLKEKRKDSEGLISGWFNSFSAEDDARLSELQKQERAAVEAQETKISDQIKQEEVKAPVNKPVPEVRKEDTQAPDSQKPAATNDTKRYTAEEWAKLHAGETEEEDGYDDQVEKTPVSPGLPDGDYTRRGGGEWVDNKTGKAYDRYGNPAGGTYSADGSSWEIGDSADAAGKVPMSAEQKAKPTSAAADAALETQLPTKVKSYRDADVRGDSSLAAVSPAIAARLEQNKPIAAQPPAPDSSSSPLQLAGRIKLEGLNEVIAEFTAPRMVDTPSGGPSIVNDPPRPSV